MLGGEKKGKRYRWGRRPKEEEEEEEEAKEEQDEQDEPEENAKVCFMERLNRRRTGASGYILRQHEVRKSV